MKSLRSSEILVLDIAECGISMLGFENVYGRVCPNYHIVHKDNVDSCPFDLSFLVVEMRFASPSTVAVTNFCC